MTLTIERLREVAATWEALLRRRTPAERWQAFTRVAERCDADRVRFQTTMEDYAVDLMALAFLLRGEGFDSVEVEPGTTVFKTIITDAGAWVRARELEAAADLKIGALGSTEDTNG